MSQSTAAEQQLTEFVSRVFDEKGLTRFTDEMRHQAITDMVQLLGELIDRSVLAAMPEEKLDELNRMLEDSSMADDAVKDFVTNSGVDIEKVTLDTLTRFRDAYLDSASGDTK